MTEHVAHANQKEPRNAGRLALSMAWRLSLFLGGVVGIISVSAGQWDLWFVWAYAVVYVVGMAVGTIVVYRKDPTLFQERMKPGPGGKDPNLRKIAMALVLAHIVLAGVDIGRRHWSGEVPPVVHFAGLALLAFAMGMSCWSLSANRFFSSDARIQRDRGHHVVTSGPYRYIRHPGYLAAILMSLAGPLALGSYVSALPMLVVAGLFLRRLLLEERLLASELEGYAEYMQQVRYRLLAGIW